MRLFLCRFFYRGDDDDDAHDVDGDGDGGDEDLFDSGVSFCQVSFFMNFSTDRPPVYLIVIMTMVDHW